MISPWKAPVFVLGCFHQAMTTEGPKGRRAEGLCLWFLDVPKVPKEFFAIWRRRFITFFLGSSSLGDLQFSRHWNPWLSPSRFFAGGVVQIQDMEIEWDFRMGLLALVHGWWFFDRENQGKSNPYFNWIGSRDFFSVDFPFNQCSEFTQLNNEKCWYSRFAILSACTSFGRYHPHF